MLRLTNTVDPLYRMCILLSVVERVHQTTSVGRRPDDAFQRQPVSPIVIALNQGTNKTLKTLHAVYTYTAYGGDKRLTNIGIRRLLVFIIIITVHCLGPISSLW